MTLREKALAFATLAHKGQKRKDGKDYITHPIAVAEIAERLYRSYIGQDTDDIYVAALLHDVEEDTEFTYQDIEREFGTFIANRVHALSRQKGETYFDFIMRLSLSYFMDSLIKLADLEHNLSDLQEGSMKDKYRFAKYLLEKTLQA